MQMILESYKKQFRSIWTSPLVFMMLGAKGLCHGLTLGLVVLLDNKYKIKSNREFGDGRYDISLFPRKQKYLGIIMELKWKNGLGKAEVEEL